MMPYLVISAASAGLGSYRMLTAPSGLEDSIRNHGSQTGRRSSSGLVAARRLRKLSKLPSHRGAGNMHVHSFELLDLQLLHELVEARAFAGASDFIGALERRRDAVDAALDRLGSV